MRTSEVPSGLFHKSSIPMKRSIATTMGTMVAATTTRGSTVASSVLTMNQATICRLALDPTVASDMSAMRRSRPHRDQTVVRMLAPTSRMISSSA